VSRLRLAVWSPLPPSPSGIADYAAEQLPFLRERFDVELVAAAPAGARPEADLDLYQVGNSPAHVFVYRAALERPGVVLLHDWSVHDLVLAESVARVDRRGYLREMRRAYGERGSFLGSQILRGLGGEDWPALLPLNDRLLESCLGLVALTGEIARRAAERLGERPVLQLPHHLALPLDPWPARDEARAALGLSREALLVTAPGLATRSKRVHVVARVVSRLRRLQPALQLVLAGALDAGFEAALLAPEDPDGVIVTGPLSLQAFLRQLAAADIVSALRFPSRGEISGALVRSLGAARPALVTAGTPAAEEFPEGVVVPVSPDRYEEAELEALLEALLRDRDARVALGAAAREFLHRHHDLRSVTARLADFLERAAGERVRHRAALQPIAAGPLGELLDEIHFAGRELQLPGVPEGLVPLLAPLATGGK
jgi:glycosyltransferase involved in cell wall biosynthesis